MMDIEPDVLRCITLEAQSTFDIVQKLYENEWEVKTKRGMVFKALCNLESKGSIESKKIKASRSSNPARYWALPGGTYPDEFSGH